MTGKEALAAIKSQFIGDLESLETDEWWAEEKKVADINWWKEKFQIVEKDLEVLEAIEKSITFEPPKDFKNSLYFNNYIVVYNKIPITKELQEKLTQWIIHNIDKEKVRKWLENDNFQVLDIFKKYLKFKISDKPANDGSYIIFIDDFEDDYACVCFAISKEERDILKEWLKEENND